MEDEQKFCELDLLDDYTAELEHDIKRAWGCNLTLGIDNSLVPMFINQYQQTCAFVINLSNPDCTQWPELINDNVTFICLLFSPRQEDVTRFLDRVPHHAPILYGLSMPLPIVNVDVEAIKALFPDVSPAFGNAIQFNRELPARPVPVDVLRMEKMKIV